MMHAGTIGRTIVDHAARIEFFEHLQRATDMSRISVTQHQPIEAVDAARVQIVAQDILIIARARTIQ